jgi:hypothetical protein
MRIATIVEGHGDVVAVPILIRRLIEASGVPVSMQRPIRLPRGKLVKKDEFQRVIELAARATSVEDRILVLFDSDEDCAARLAPQLRAWAAQARSDRRVHVVLAVREFEAWFLAAAGSLAGQRGLAADVGPPADPEAVADAKGWLSGRMRTRYSETIDQPAFAATFDLVAARTCPSFEKLAREVGAMLSR